LQFLEVREEHARLSKIMAVAPQFRYTLTLKGNVMLSEGNVPFGLC
jgi:hypothetical protein